MDHGNLWKSKSPCCSIADANLWVAQSLTVSGLKFAPHLWPGQKGPCCDPEAPSGDLTGRGHLGWASPF